MRSTVPTAFAVTSLLHFHAFGQDCPSNLISSSFRNTRKVQSVTFTRRGNDSSPPESVNADFQLYYPKYERAEVCANRTWPSLDSELCLDAKKWDKPIHCNTFNTNTRNEKLPTPDTLWRPCTGRITFGPSFVDEARCKNVTLLDALSGKAGTCYEGIIDVEDKSDQPWAKWRVLKLDEPPNPTRNDTRDPATTRPFRSIALEVITAQRYYPSGKSVAEDQIVVYNSTFTVSRDMMDCRIQGPGTYTCRLEVSQLDPYLPRKSCFQQGAFMLFVASIPTPCAFQVRFDYRAMSLNQYKETYWR